MNNNQKPLADAYQLLPLAEQYIRTLYQWNVEETHMEYYTCRPLALSQSYEEYADKTSKAISEGKNRTWILVETENCMMPLGKITLFDNNPRNHSAEFGYYLPAKYRGRGLGSVMLSQFITISFTDDQLDLNKLYATTSSNNCPSIKLLERHGFTLDGRLREHYWIQGDKYDQLVYSMLKSDWKPSKDNHRL